MIKYGIGDVERFFKRTLQLTKYDAVKRRNLQFNIDLNDIILMFFDQQGKCALTGWDLELVHGGNFKSKINPRVATMDRIDNTLGYVPGNIQLTCSYPNFIKGSLSNNEFIDLCKLVVENQSKK